MWENDLRQTQNRALGGTFLSVAMILCIGLLTIIFHHKLYKTPAIQVSYAANNPTIIVQRDKNNHFWLPIKINGIPYNAMLDSGATYVVVDDSLARKTKLPKIAQTQFQTANGQVSGYISKIAVLNIAELEIRGLRAGIVNGLDNTVLLGANFLKLFTITQKGDFMFLEYNDNAN